MDLAQVGERQLRLRIILGTQILNFLRASDDPRAAERIPEYEAQLVMLREALSCSESAMAVESSNTDGKPKAQVIKLKTLSLTGRARR